MRLFVAVLLAVLPCCSACQGRSGQDASKHDATLDRGPIPDLPPPDRSPDGPQIPCGGSRTLTLIPVQRGPGLACGPGCKQVTFGADVSIRYEVKGDLLVYSGGGDMDPSVYLVDLKQDKEWLVKKAKYPKKPGCFWVSTDGKRLAYDCDDWEDPKQPYHIIALHIFDPQTSVESDARCLTMVHDKSGVPDYLSLGETGIAMNMSLTSSSSVDAFFHRFSDGSLTNLTKKYGGVWHTNMSGSRIVWTEAITTTQIVLHDTVSGTRKVLDPTGKAQFVPRIEGDKVVWIDHRNAPGDMWNQTNSDIYLHDLATGKTEAVTTHPARQDFPDVWGDWVVWQDWRNNPNPTPQSGFKNADIFARNMKTMKVNEELQVTSFPGQEVRPKIDAERVFYQMGDGNKVSIFMVDLAQLTSKQP
jgi:beta propeller repeat protein